MTPSKDHETFQTLKNHIQQLEEHLIRPDHRVHPEAISPLLGDAFVEFGSSGHVWYKEDCVRSDGMTPRELALSDFQLRSLSETVVLATYLITDTTRQQKTLRSSIWTYMDMEGRWQMVFHQGTPTLLEQPFK